jgi:hypothetical protein
MESLKIKDNLYLVRQEVEPAKTVLRRPSVNHIWIYDRSGSMHGALTELTNQLITLSKQLPKDDTLTLGWFSSEGDYNFIVKGFKITDESDYESLEKLIKANNNTRGCTCFSEILYDARTVIEDLSVFSPVFSLHFFTDGYPVVNNYRKEITDIFEAIAAIKGKIHTAMLVGYGSYYNKELMGQMAEKLGALLIHSSMIPEYAESITKLVNLASVTEPKQPVDAVAPAPLAVFSVTDQGVVLLSVEDGKVYVSPNAGKKNSVYTITNKCCCSKPVRWSAVDFSQDDNPWAAGIYAAALVLTQQTKTDLALEFIGKVGDIKIIDELNNAFTIEEYGAVESLIGDAVHRGSARFREGRGDNYLPSANAFCVFDLLNLLVDDTDAYFYPYHKNFEYHRIGAAQTKTDEYPDFHPDKESRCSFNNLVWHSSRLNLSVQTVIRGTVYLKEVDKKTPKDVGLDEYFNSYVYRNFTFIKDGRVHIKKLFVHTSEKTYKLLKNKGLVMDDAFQATGVYGIDLGHLPAINRAIANDKCSATELCKLVYEEQRLKGIIKALKYLKDQEFSDATTAESSYTEEQTQFLLANGINAKKNGLYSPLVQTVETTDKYMAKYFDIKIEKLSSLPTVKKVIEKMEANKIRTPVESLIEEGIVIYQGTSLKDRKKLAWVEEQIQVHSKKMREIRVKIQTIKFAVILGKKWFDEFASREETQLTVDGRNFKFDLGEEQVAI